MYCLLQGTMERRKKVHEARKPLLQQPAPPTVSMTCMSCFVISSSFLCHGDIDNHVVASEWLNNQAGTKSLGREGRRRRAHGAWRPGGQRPSRRRRRYHPCVLSPPHHSPLCRGADDSQTPHTTPYFAEIGILLFEHLL